MNSLSKFPFYLFGMGNRDKYYYKDSCLFRYPSHEVAYRFEVEKEILFPDKYTLQLDVKSGRTIIIREDETGVYIDDGTNVTALTCSRICLPQFDGNENAPLLRILHHEILVNIIDGKPVPNYFVYPKPWYRDAAMMTMVLQQTGNLSLIRKWILSLDDCFDRNNKGCEEPDNLGQALYMLSCVTDTSYPFVGKLIKEAQHRMKDGFLQGTVDYGNHPVYAAKWLKYGLESLHCDSSWVSIPEVEDDYSQLFWMDYRDKHITMPQREYSCDYPYLWWAEQHFFGNYVNISDILPDRIYPITNETFASEADYEAIRPLSEAYADNKNASPHTWHAAEMFLYLNDNNIIKNRRV